MLMHGKHLDSLSNVRVQYKQGNFHGYMGKSLLEILNDLQ